MSDSDKIPTKFITVSQCQDIQVEVINHGLLLITPEAPEYDFSQTEDVMAAFDLPQEVPDWFSDGYTQGVDGHWRPTHLVLPPGDGVSQQELLETPIPGAFVFMATVLALALWSLKHGRNKT